MLHGITLLYDGEWVKILTKRDIAIYSLGKTEGVNSIAETLGKGLDDEKYIESWNKTMKMLGIELPLKELEKIYNEFSIKMDEVVSADENKEDTSKANQKEKREVESFHTSKK